MRRVLKFVNLQDSNFKCNLQLDFPNRALIDSSISSFKVSSSFSFEVKFGTIYVD